MALYETVRGVLSNYDELPNTPEVVEEIMSAIDPADYAEYLKEALPAVIRRVVSNTRVQLSDVTLTAGETVKKPKIVHHQKSSHVTAMQNAASRLKILNQLYTGANETTKRLACFTSDDLGALVETLAVQRDTSEAKRKRFDALKTVVDTKGVKVVEELSDEEIAAALGI